MRQIAVLSGGDWVDASVEHIKVNDEVDLDAEKKLYDKWYQEVYVPAYNKSPVEFMTFVEWLIKKDKAVLNDDIEEWRNF